ncbi:MAG: hypothetical protein JNK49_05755 [Planctomycetes bacterium]|nr:hypothetical protein [Planctomycetota bacterium]
MALGQASPEQLAEYRREVARDPLAALQFAETLDLFERCRQATVAPSFAFAGKLHDVVLRAERLGRFRGVRRPAPRWPGWLAAAAAVATFALLRALAPELPVVAVVAVAAPDPLVPAASRPAAVGNQNRAGAEGAPGQPAAVTPVELPLRTRAEVAFDQSLAQIRRRLDVEGLRAAEQELALGLAAPSDALARWVDGHNALVLLQRRGEWQHEPASGLRSTSPSGATLLARIDGLRAAVAADLDAQLAAGPDASLPDLVLSARALWRAGLDRAAGQRIAAATRLVADRLGTLRGPELVGGLALVLEGSAGAAVGLDAAARAGQRLLDELLQADPEAWGRRLPELLQRRVPVASLAEAGRVLALLPGVGLPPKPCLLARRLVLGVLRERRAGERGPEPLAALVYGFADLLAEGERDQFETELRRWHPARLWPDHQTVQQLACGIEPGRLGHTRLLGQLRRLCAVPEPSDVGGRAGLLWCLCTALDLPAATAASGE